MTDTDTRRDGVRVLASAWVLLTLAVLAMGWLLTGLLESVVDPWDDRVAVGIEERRTPALDVAAAAGSHVADTVVGIALAVVIALVAWRWQGSRRPLVYYGVLVVGALAFHLTRTVASASRWVWPLYAVPLVVAVSRLYQGAHHPTDVLTSLVVAPLWVAAVAHVVLPRRVSAQ